MRSDGVYVYVFSVRWAREVRCGRWRCRLGRIDCGGGGCGFLFMRLASYDDNFTLPVDDETGAKYGTRDGVKVADRGATERQET
jgi:hypothetical protein